MDVLVLGGTGFIGRHVVTALLAAGHAVSVFSRGVLSTPLPASVERLQGDRTAATAEAGLAALSHRAWSACVDCGGYTPAQLRPVLDALAPRLQRYVFLSAVMVYGDVRDGVRDGVRQGPVFEDHARVAPATGFVAEVDSSSYGPLKVACEDLLEHTLGPRCTLLRPQVVVGPHDRSGRLAYWQQRARQGGRVLAPGGGNDGLQFIDVRDVADFVATVLQHDLAGAYNLAGQRLRWAQFMQALGVAEPQWVPAAVLLAAGLGFRELPLFRPAGGLHSGLMHVSSERAQAAGLRLTPLETTLRDAETHTPPLTGMAWLTPEQEAVLLAAAAAKNA